MFSNLHTHTEYSLLDGLSRIPQLLDRAKALGQEAMAITDHGGMYGVIEFYKEARKREMRPILGVEAYVAPGPRTSRDPREKNAYHHLTLLARDFEGYRNLMRLTTKANLEGYYYKPRMDRELLAEYGKGIIALSGCPSAEVFKCLLDGREDQAKSTLGFYRDVFDDVFVEIQDHPDANGELRQMLDTANPRLVELARATGLPLVATNDSHYTLADDAPTHEVLLCIGTGSTIDDPKRFRLEGDTYFLKSEREMLDIFRDLPEAVANTQRVVESCDITLEFGRVQLPNPELPPGKTSQEYLAELCFQGLIRRYGADAAGAWPLVPRPDPPTPGEPGEVRRRLEYELHVVEVTGFASYMLIVAEIARAAAERGIAMGVRGSAAASIILYTLGVTDIDPIASRLVFERFLNVERREMPDVDMDFADDRREEMIRWAAERYGHDRVAQICTFGTLGAKAAIRDVGRALGMSFSETDRVARLVPSALHMTIDRALTENAEFKQVYDADGNVRRLVDTARRLEGVARHAGTHAAGVLISHELLIDVIPLQKAARGDDGALPVAQFEMNTVAEIGLLKMDFLGLSNLTILARAVELIKQTRGIDLDLKTIPDGDAKTYDMLSRGETFGVFQLESAGMRRYIQELKPGSIAELSALVALYRPGPMQHIPTYVRAKHGLEPIGYPHPDLANILDETYGVITYQDQVLFILRQFAGYTMGEADKVRKAMGKKIAELMGEQRVKFIKGAGKQGYSKDDANAIFDLIEPFAGYAFNKAHSVCYGTVAYQTAFLKANYPAEYMTAVLALADAHPSGFAERVGAAVSECAKLGIEVLPPDVNTSQVSFAVEQTGPQPPAGAGPQPPAPSPNAGRGGEAFVPSPRIPTLSGQVGRGVASEASRGEGPPPAAGEAPFGEAIRFGLATVKNVGASAVEGIIAARQEGGRYASLEDFCKRADLKGVNKRTLESLIKAGALDGFGFSRTTLVANLDRVASLISREQRLRETGQATMFDLFGDQVPVPLPALELDIVPDRSAETLSWEKELLGVYVSEHPYRRAHPALSGRISAVLSEITDEMTGRDLIIAGMVASTRTLLTKAGKSFVVAKLEDLSGTVEVVAWPDVYEQTREVWEQGRILLASVKVRTRDERLDVIVNEVQVWDESAGLVGPSIQAPEPAPRTAGWDGFDAGPSAADLAAFEDDGEYPPEDPERDAWGPDVSPSAHPAEAPSREEQPLPAGSAPSAEGGSSATRGGGSAPSVAARGGSARGRRGEPPPKPLPSEDRAPRRLRIAVRETDDEAGDRRRLNDLVQLLRAIPGDDEVRLTLQTPHDEREFSLGNALVTDGIEQRLRPILSGWGDMTIETVRAAQSA